MRSFARSRLGAAVERSNPSPDSRKTRGYGIDSGHYPSFPMEETQWPNSSSSPPRSPRVAIAGSDERIPVSRIFCVGRNYEDHAKEMGQQVDREKPFYFTKAPSAVVPTGSTIPYAPGTSNYHYEFELVVVIGAPAFRASKEEALAKVYGYACGLDMTRRDLQLAERAKQLPWDLGKDVEFSVRRSLPSFPRPASARPQNRKSKCARTA